MLYIPAPKLLNVFALWKVAPPSILYSNVPPIEALIVIEPSLSPQEINSEVVISMASALQSPQPAGSSMVTCQASKVQNVSVVTTTL